MPNMERRDGYFTRLKVRVETTHQLHGEKVAPAFASSRDTSGRGYVSCSTMRARGLHLVHSSFPTRYKHSGVPPDRACAARICRPWDYCGWPDR